MRSKRRARRRTSPATWSRSTPPAATGTATGSASDCSSRPRLTQISQNGRVVLWQRLARGGTRRERDVSYSLRRGQGCYDLDTGADFERTGVIEMRRGIVVPQELIDEAELAESGGSHSDPLARSYQ